MININTKNIIDFSIAVERLVEQKKLTYLEAIMEYIKEERIDAEIVPTLLSPSLSQKLEQECSDLNLIKKEKKLKMV
jgi:hypothetical protein